MESIVQEGLRRAREFGAAVRINQAQGSPDIAAAADSPVSCWQPPAGFFLKVDSDAASDKAVGTGSVGTIFPTSQGCLIQAHFKLKPGVQSALVAEQWMASARSGERFQANDAHSKSGVYGTVRG